jgi:hypothetical protein
MIEKAQATVALSRWFLVFFVLAALLLPELPPSLVIAGAVLAAGVFLPLPFFFGLAFATLVLSPPTVPIIAAGVLAGFVFVPYAYRFWRTGSILLPVVAWASFYAIGTVLPGLWPTGDVVTTVDTWEEALQYVAICLATGCLGLGILMGPFRRMLQGAARELARAPDLVALCREREEAVRKRHPEAAAGEIARMALHEKHCPHCRAGINTMTGEGMRGMDGEPWTVVCASCEKPVPLESLEP